MVTPEVKTIHEALVKSGYKQVKVVINGFTPTITRNDDQTINKQKTFFTVTTSEKLPKLVKEVDDENKVTVVEKTTNTFTLTFYDVKRLLQSNRYTNACVERFTQKPEVATNLLLEAAVTFLYGKVAAGKYKNPFSDNAKEYDVDHDWINIIPVEITALDELAKEDALTIRRANL